MPARLVSTNLTSLLLESLMALAAAEVEAFRRSTSTLLFSSMPTWMERAASSSLVNRRPVEFIDPTCDLAAGLLDIGGEAVTGVVDLRRHSS